MNRDQRTGLWFIFGILLGLLAMSPSRCEAQSSVPAYPDCVWRAIDKVQTGRVTVVITYPDGTSSPPIYTIMYGDKFIQARDHECNIIPLMYAREHKNLGAK